MSPVRPSLTWEEIDRRVSPAVAMVLKAYPLRPTPKNLALLDGALTEEAKLDYMDGRDPIRRQNFAKYYAVKLEGGKQYQIDMTSKEIDSFLRLEDAKHKQLAQDDDSGGNQDARIVFNCPANGTYVIVASTFTAGTGNFALKVTEVSAASK